MGKFLWQAWVIAVWVSLALNALMQTDGFTNTSPDALMMAFVIPLFFPLFLIVLPKLLFIFLRNFLRRHNAVDKVKKISRNAGSSVQGAMKSNKAKILALNEDYFGIANDEIESNDQKKGLWAKALAISEGDERKQKAVYLRLRVEQLKEDTNTSEKGCTKTQSRHVDGESDFIPSDSVQKPEQPEQPEPESCKFDESDKPSSIAYVKTHRDEIEEDLARWRNEHAQQKVSQPQPQPEPQKTHEPTSPAPISNDPTNLSKYFLYAFYAFLVILVISILLPNDTYEPNKPESGVKTRKPRQASEPHENPYKTIIDFQTTQCEAGETNACRILANAYRKGQMDLAKNLDLALKYEAMAQIDTQGHADAENTVTSFSAVTSDVYTVEGFLSATFGGQPFLAGEVGSGRTRVKSYQFFDEENVIVYSLNFDVERAPTSESEIPSLLEIEVEADSKLNKSSISNYRTKVMGSQLVAFFSVRYFINGLYWTKVKMVTIVHGRTIRWAVQTADEYSSVQAATIFNQGYQKLQICGYSLFSENIPICDPN